MDHPAQKAGKNHMGLAYRWAQSDDVLTEKEYLHRPRLY